MAELDRHNARVLKTNKEIHSELRARARRDQAAVAIDEKKRALWSSLRDFIHQEGGWVISLPDAFPMRAEVRRGSSLPARLAAYDPRQCGATTRIVPDEIIQVDVFEIDAPRGGP